MLCQLCNEEVKSVKALALHINNKHPETDKEQYFIKFMSINNEHLCLNCGKPNKFRGFAKRCGTYCSTKCMANSKEIQNKRKDTIVDKYGVENISQIVEVKEKKKQINQEKFGVDYYFQSEEGKEKIKETMVERHGVENPMMLDEFKEKQKNSLFTNHGVTNPQKSKEINQKSKNTMFNKYGKEYYSQTPEYRIKIKETCLVNHGAEHHMKNKTIKDKVKNTHKKNFFNYLITSNRFDTKVTPLFDLDSYKGSFRSNKYEFQCNTCNSIFEDNIGDGRIPRCLSCYPYQTYTSKEEYNIVEFLKSILPENTIILQNDRTLINPFELDIYIPEYKLAIEYNGIYWHSEQQGKDKNYHINKTNLCNNKGVKLIHVFDSEWLNKQDIICSIIRNKLNLSSTKIYARKCEIKKVKNIDAQEFLFNNHIQGVIFGNHYGLYFNNELVSLLSMGKSRYNKNYDFEILRFCSKLNTNVIGGFSKLLKYFINNNPGTIITYADLRYGTGDVYLKSNFTYSHISSPNYYYTTDFMSLESRHKFQKHKLNKILTTFDNNLSEYQNMLLNNYDRIWDCGNNVYILN